MQFYEAALSDEFQTVELFVFSDLHIGDPLFNKDLFFECRDWVLAAPNRFCILNGDICNVALKDSVSDIYGDVMSPAEQLKWAKKEFEPLRGRVLAITEGNHEQRVYRATSLRMMEALAEHLGCPEKFFPDGVLLKLCFGQKRNNKRAVYTIYATHGRGGGALMGGKVLRMSRMSGIVVADVFLAGHTHTKVAFKESIYVPDLYNNTVRLVEQTYVNSASMLNWGGYSQVHGYKPGAQGSPRIVLYAEPKRVEVVI